MKKLLIAATVVAGFYLVHKYGGDKLAKYCPFMVVTEEDIDDFIFSHV